MPRRVLLVDDNPGDLELMIEALGEFDRGIVVHPVKSAATALSYLAQEGEPGTQPRPDLLVLDINMPVMNGLEALKVIKGHAAWRSIPIAVFSCTPNPKEHELAIRLGAAAFFIKPVTWNAYVALAKTIIECLDASTRTGACPEGEARQGDASAPPLRLPQ